MTHEPPAPAPGRRRITRRLVIIVAVVLVACCAGGGIASWALLRWYATAAGPAQKVTEDFFTDLEKDDTGAAYGLPCPDVRAPLPESSFAGYVHAEPRLRGHKVVGTSVQTVNGTSTALITTDLTREGGVHDRRTVRLGKDGRAGGGGRAPRQSAPLPVPSRTGSSEHPRRHVAGLDDRPPDRYQQQRQEPDHEEHQQRHDRHPVRVG